MNVNSITTLSGVAKLTCTKKALQYFKSPTLVDNWLQYIVPRSKALLNLALGHIKSPSFSEVNFSLVD